MYIYTYIIYITIYYTILYPWFGGTSSINPDIGTSQGHQALDLSWRMWEEKVCRSKTNLLMGYEGIIISLYIDIYVDIVKLYDVLGKLLLISYLFKLILQIGYSDVYTTSWRESSSCFVIMLSILWLSHKDLPFICQRLNAVGVAATLLGAPGAIRAKTSLDSPSSSGAVITHLSYQLSLKSWNARCSLLKTNSWNMLERENRLLENEMHL